MRSARTGHACVHMRTPLLVVPTPALTPWAAEARASATSSAVGAPQGLRPSDTAAARKRGAPDDADAAVEMATDAAAAAAAATAGGAGPTASIGEGVAKRSAGDGRAAAPSEQPDAGTAAAFRYGSAGAWRSAIVKLYDGHGDGAGGARAGAPAAAGGADEEAARGLRLNDVVEFVGVLSLESDLPNDLDALALDALADDPLAHRPRGTAVPRVHCVSFRRERGRPNALLPPHDAVAERAAAVAAARAAAPALREAALDVLRAALGGDALAAEYALLWALSSVHARVGAPGALTAVGALPLALQAPSAGGAGGALGEPLAEALGALLPLFKKLTLDVPSLNAAVYAPARDEASNCLCDAALQLPAGTALLADEGALQGGQLGEKGVANVRALAELAARQSVHYDFGVYALPYDADVPVLLLSRGRSIVPPPPEQLSVAVAQLDAAACACGVREALARAEAGAPGGLRGVRAYLTLAADEPAELEPELVEAAQSEFVAARQADPSVGAHTLHAWCTLARLVARSSLRAVDAEQWAKMRALEDARAARSAARDAQARTPGVAV